jgi:hypothetical protein
MQQLTVGQGDPARENCTDIDRYGTSVMDLLGSWPESRATPVAIAAAMHAATAGSTSRDRVKQLGE